MLYLADNGWLTAEGRRRQPRIRAKISPYYLGVRTPFLVRWPGKVDPGRDDETLVSSIDLVPTMLRAAEIEPPATMPGIDLRNRERLAGRQPIFGATFAHSAVDIHDPIANLKYRRVVDTNGWKLTLPFKPNAEVPLMICGTKAAWMRLAPELYQLLEDPYETDDRADKRPDFVRELQAAVQDWWSVPG